jgi:tRNA threonylcarbamoyl adenosine modification protein (Sua5/YciO/YrdC/YwlC family)
MAPTVIDIRSAEDLRDVVHLAVQALAEGKVVAFPTETVYAVAASALDPVATARLLTAKRRKSGQPPLTLAVKSADDALDYVPRMSRLAQRIARRCWPGPITLVCHDDHPESVLTQLPQPVREAVVPSGTIGLRVPGHPVFLDVMRMLAGPIVVSSANRSGQPDSQTAAEVVRALGDDVQLVLDDGQSRFGVPSTVVKVNEKSFELLRVGVVSEQTLRRLASLVILFVCTGNTCRSPMAETIARKLIADRLGCRIDQLEDRGVIVQSAGLSAMSGGGAAAEAIDVIAAMGLDLGPHESQPLTGQMVRYADMIFPMTRSHRQAILSQWPEAASRTELLAVDQSDIADPIGGPPDVYRRCAEQLQVELGARVAKLEL